LLNSSKKENLCSFIIHNRSFLGRKKGEVGSPSAVSHQKTFTRFFYVFLRDKFKKMCIGMQEIFDEKNSRLGVGYKIKMG
jgi:hypothetical protein